MEKVKFIESSALGVRIEKREDYMKNSKEFPFEKARKISLRETAAARKAIERKTGKKRKSRGRPSKTITEKYKPISIRLHPKIVIWAKREAKKQGVGYQTIINEILLKKVS